jgi:ribonuclease BN (tRNA processing enzyme)
MYHTGVLFLQDKNCYGFTKGESPSALFLFRSFDGKQSGLVPTKIHTRTRRNQFCTVMRLKEQINNDPRISFIIHIHHGEVDEPAAFSRAMLTYHSLEGKKIYHKKIPYEPSQFARNKSVSVYTIDPDGCEDIDDGISFQKDRIGIHITYVGHHMVNYEFPNYCTLYPQIRSNIHMLPEKYAKDDFSLVAKKWRNVISLYLKIDGSHEWVLEQIKVRRNMSYEQADEMLGDKLNIYHSHGDYYINRIGLIPSSNWASSPNPLNTKILIEKFALIYNCFAMETILRAKQVPILRIHSIEQNRGSYCFGNPSPRYIYVHEGLGIQNYGHITSPIRRYVDIYNQTRLMRAIQPEEQQEPSQSQPKFNLPRPVDIEDINQKMVAGKRYMASCELYGLFANEELPENIRAKIINIEGDSLCVEINLLNRTRHRYIPSIPYYLETNWQFDPVKCYYKHISGTKKYIKMGGDLTLRILRDRNPYPRIMLVPVFLLVQQEAKSAFRSLVENVCLPGLPD